MGGALVTFAVGYALLRKECGLPGGGSEPITKRLIVGAILFGIGWGLSGFCPEPALADLGRMATEALVFVPTMAVGMVLAQRLAGADA